MNIIKDDDRSTDIKAVSMSVSKNGLFGLFCGSCNILLINFDDPKANKKLPVIKCFEPMLCQWNKSSNDMFALSINNICKLYDLELNKILSLKFHNKCISSLDWHPNSVNKIATTSVEGTRSLCIWDIRNSKCPSLQINNFGIFKVSWNKNNFNIFATSFNTEINVWDERKLSAPISNLRVHDGSIIDFDWHPKNKNILMSCGKDKKMKIWNFFDGFSTATLEFEENICLCRSKFDLLGNMVTLTSSELSENQLVYWDFASFSKLCYTPLSSNIIIDFDGKSLSNDTCELVTLYRSFDFKLWQFNIPACFVKRKREISSYMTGPIFTSGVPTDRVPNQRSESLSHGYHSDPNLMREWSNRSVYDDILMRYREFDKLAQTNQISFEKNYELQSVIVTFTLAHIKCSIQFLYRPISVDIAVLEINVLPGRSEKLRQQNLEELEQILNTTADDCKIKNTPPIEKCLDAATEYLNKLSSKFSARGIRTILETNYANSFYCNLPDVRIPFPRLCGATFSPSGLLVCFVSPPGYTSRFHTTPRTLADVAMQSTSAKGYFYDMNIFSKKNSSQKQFHQTNRKLKPLDLNIEALVRKPSVSTMQKFTHLLTIYNVLQLSVFNLSLAKSYSIDISNIEMMCQQNNKAVTDSSRKDLIEFWQYCIILVNGCKSNYNFIPGQIKPWSSQFMVRRLCKLWLQHFIKIFDIQNAAMFILVMRALEIDLENIMDNKYTRSSLSITDSHKNVSQESLMENSEHLNKDSTYKNLFCVLFAHHDEALDYLKRESTVVHFPMQKFYNSHHSSTTSEGFSRNILPATGRLRNNSTGESDQLTISKRNDFLPEIILKHKENLKLLDPSKRLFYDRILQHYARILTAQDLLNVAVKITHKIMPLATINSVHSQYNFKVLLIRNCSQDHGCRSVYYDNVRSTVICSDCHSINVPIQDITLKSPVVCSICRLYVRGLVTVCPHCNHGGHIDHMKSWFSLKTSQGYCPTGCGCICCFSKDVYFD